MGGRLSFGADLAATARQGAIFVATIFKRAQAADPPVEQPTKFDLIINLKAAKALGLTIPHRSCSGLMRSFSRRPCSTRMAELP